MGAAEPGVAPEIPPDMLPEAPAVPADAPPDAPAEAACAMVALIPTVTANNIDPTNIWFFITNSLSSCAKARNPMMEAARTGRQGQLDDCTIGLV
jgi:hypothetical protein